MVNCHKGKNVSNDAISRKQAIEAMGEEPMVWNDDDAFALGERNQWERDVEALRELPPVEPERKKGKWTRHFDGNEWYWYCSSCKEQWYEEDLWMGGNSFPNFCPNCGCQMNGGEQDE